MARIAGIDLPKNKRGEIGLTYIYGIGRPSATRILKEAGCAPFRSTNKHQALDGHRLLPWHPPSFGAAPPRTKYKEQCPYSQRS